jgi:hypothetical protein
MSVDSRVTLFRGDAARAAHQSRVPAVRRLLTGCLTSDRAGCTEAIDLLGAGWLAQQGLAPMVWQKCRTSDLSHEVQSELRAAYYVAAGNMELRRCELASVLRALSEADLPVVAFKGAALAFGVYADPAFRTMGDLDLWLAAHDMERARQVLENCGYQSYCLPGYSPAEMMLFEGELGLWNPQPGGGWVELHWSIYQGEWLRRAANVGDLSPVRTRAISTQLAGERTQILAPEDAIIQSAVHTAVNHQMSLFALRALLDVTAMARAATVDWSAVVQRAREWRMATAVWLVLSLAVELAGLEEAVKAVRELQPSTLRRRILHFFVNPETLIEMRNLSSGRRRFLYLLLLIDRVPDAFRLLGRTLWPDAAWLKTRYGRATVKVRVWHLLDAVRRRI